MTPLRKILRELNLKKLKKLKTSIAPKIGSYKNKNDLENRIKKSINRNDEVDIGDVISEIISIVREGKTRVTSRIKNSIREMEVSKKADHGKVCQKEFFIHSEFFQAISYKLKIKDEYSVYQERGAGEGRVDLTVESKNKGAKYLIEMKIINRKNEMDSIEGQIGKYLGSPKINKLYLVLIIEKESITPDRSDYIENKKSDIEDVDDRIEVILKGPSDLRYKQ